MQVTELHIRRNEYGPDKGRMTGQVKFSGPFGDVSINVDEETSNHIVRLCADGIAKAGQDVANLMAAEIIESSQVLIEES